MKENQYSPTALSALINSGRFRLPLTHTRSLEVLGALENVTGWNSIAHRDDAPLLKARARVLRAKVNELVKDSVLALADAEAVIAFMAEASAPLPTPNPVTPLFDKKSGLVNLKKFGAPYDKNAPGMARLLKTLGLCDAKGVPLPGLIDGGVAKKVAVNSYGGGGLIPVYRWNPLLLAKLLADRGVLPLTDEELGQRKVARPPSARVLRQGGYRAIEDGFRLLPQLTIERKDEPNRKDLPVSQSFHDICYGIWHAVWNCVGVMAYSRDEQWEHRDHLREETLRALDALPKEAQITANARNVLRAKLRNILQGIEVLDKVRGPDPLTCHFMPC